jgi:hypothetical protein
MSVPYTSIGANIFAKVMKPFREKLSAYSGQQYHYVADASSSDVTLSGNQLNCRYAKVDVTGIIKIDYKGDNDSTRTEVLIAVAGAIIQIPNITKVYQNYKAATACTAQVYGSDGLAVVGLKLCY